MVNEAKPNLAPTVKRPAISRPIATNLRRATHKTIKGVADDIEAFAMNKAVAKVRELSNAISVFTAATDDEKWALRESIETLIILMNPMMPHLAEELWKRWVTKPCWLKPRGRKPILPCSLPTP
jgi:leucyl-tRNA synthetase